MARLFTSDVLHAADQDDWTFGGGDFAVCFLVNYTTATGFQILLSQYFQTGQRGWYFSADATNGLTFAFCTGGTDGTVKSVAWTPGTGTWYHVIVTRIGNSLYFYVDGSQQGATQDVTGLSTAAVTQELGIGAFEGTGPVWQSYVKGHIAEVAIWKGSGLVPSEAVSLGKLFSPLLIQPQNLVGYWPLIRGLNDKINGYNLTAVGTAVSNHPRIILPQGV